MQTDIHVEPAVRSRNQPITAERRLRGAEKTSRTDLDHINPCEDHTWSRDWFPCHEAAGRVQFRLESSQTARQEEPTVVMSAFVSSRRHMLRTGLRH